MIKKALPFLAGFIAIVLWTKFGPEKLSPFRAFYKAPKPKPNDKLRNETKPPTGGGSGSGSGGNEPPDPHAAPTEYN